MRDSERPQRNMQVQFLTTGGGKWRASPNLYNTGKVRCHALALSSTGWQTGPNHACINLLIREGQHQHCVFCLGRKTRVGNLEVLGHALKEVKLHVATLIASNSDLTVAVPSALRKTGLAYYNREGGQPSDQHPSCSWQC